MAAVEAGDAGPISEELGRERDSSRGRGGDAAAEIAAFAVSTQGLSALVAGGGGVEALPTPLSAFLLEEIPFARARAHRLRVTLGETIRALRAAGVEVVGLKGAALAFFHYPDPALRPMGDLDLLLKEPRDLSRATKALAGAGWRPLLDTPRHRVFARRDERVARPAAEDPDNPIRLEVHTSFRLPVLGRVYDASAELRAQAEVRDLGGVPVAIAAGPSLLRHLLFHAAEDFAGNGIRGVQAHDFRLLARARPEIPTISSNEGTWTGVHGAAPLLYAADAIERLFPCAFEKSLFERLSAHVDPSLRARAAALPALRYTRPVRGWTRTLLSLVEGPVPRTHFVLRTLFPTLGEVKANVAPGASGPALAAAYIRVLARRVLEALRGQGPSVMSARPMSTPEAGRVLGPGEVHRHACFGPDTVNRGAVLYSCEWDGGVFESGVMWGGIFRSGVFRGGVLWGAWWRGGSWEGGSWHSGYGPDGGYRPRGEAPP